MSVADFTASLRDRARLAALDRELEKKQHLREEAEKVSWQILGDCSLEFGEFHYGDDTHEFYVDGLHFRVKALQGTVSSSSNHMISGIHDYEEIRLEMKRGNTWRTVRDLADVGENIRIIEGGK